MATTRNAQGSGTIRQRPDGRWEARYTVGRDPGTGKQVQKSIYGGTQREVRKKLTAALRDLDSGTYQEPSRITVGEWLDIWLQEYVKPSAKPNTFSSYETQVRYRLKPAFAAMRLQELKTLQLQKFFNGLQEGEKPCSPKTIKNVHGILHKALATAVELQFIPYNPADHIRLPKIIRKEIKPLEREDIIALLAALENETYKNVYLVTLFTGMREGEVLGLTWDCVNFMSGTITIKRQLQRRKEKGGGYYFNTPKNGKIRTITPADFVMQALKQEETQQKLNKLKAGRAWENSEGFVFTDAIGRHLAIQTVFLRYKRLAASINLPDSRFHDLRHTFAVVALQEGDSVKTVQEALGHATASFTLDVYGHVSEKMKEASKKRMDNYIAELKKA